MNNMDKEREWAEHMPSEGEDPDRAAKHSSTDAIRQDVESPDMQKAASAAPSQADPQAAESNREFVEDTAMRYNEAEEEFAESDGA